MSDPRLDALDALLSAMLQENQELTARNVVRASDGLFKHPSDLTRNTARRAVLELYQRRQAELRALAQKTDKNSKLRLTERLQRTQDRADRLERERDLLVAAFRGLIHGAGVTGGMAGWTKLFPHYSAAAEHLRLLGALPSADAVPLAQGEAEASTDAAPGGSP